MNRRQFIHASAALALAAHLPMAKAKPAGRKLLIGVGGAGCNILAAATRMVHEQGLRGIHTCAIDWAKLRDNAADIVVRLDEVYCSSGHKPANALECFETEAFAKRIKVGNYGTAAIFAGLNGGTGGGLTPLLAKQLAAMNVDVSVSACLPFAFEGSENPIHPTALRSLRGILPASRIHVVSLDEFARRNESLAMDEFFASTNKFLVCSAFKYPRKTPTHARKTDSVSDRSAVRLVFL
ncbi:hypothetical protein GCM10027046_13370 [Uliginosibacterium flavum]|uniref:Tubulin/FtsZ GTPase domain-containing protein n=1 Tax=Uliginosibacterium flavum TaxID=1396831 RepID=A0ABV2TQ05_9RHOO